MVSGPVGGRNSLEFLSFFPYISDDLGVYQFELLFCQDVQIIFWVQCFKLTIDIKVAFDE